jgi:ankyrin repeat protein
MAAYKYYGADELRTKVLKLGYSMFCTEYNMKLGRSLILFTILLFYTGEQVHYSIGIGIEDRSLGFSFWIVENLAPEDRPVPTRYMYLLIQEPNFTEDNLKKIFSKMSNQFPDPNCFFIEAYSDKKKLQRVIYFNFGHLYPRIEKPQEKNVTQKEGDNQGGSNYFHASYYRGAESESFSYTPDANKQEYAKVILKEKIVHYTGSINSDLIIAANENDLDKVRSLLAEGADINARDSQGESALLAAPLTGNYEIVRELLNQGADVNVKGDNGYTILMSAASSGKIELLEELLKRGADVNAKDSNDNSALTLAIYRHHTDAAKLLIKNKANVNSTEKYGVTALMMAIITHNIEIVSELLSRGADVTARNADNKTALTLAKSSNQNEIVEILKKYGAKE